MTNHKSEFRIKAEEIIGIVITQDDIDLVIDQLEELHKAEVKRLVGEMEEVKQIESYIRRLEAIDRNQLRQEILERADIK